jgi:Gpi18-like mannosyltransferase
MLVQKDKVNNETITNESINIVKNSLEELDKVNIILEKAIKEIKNKETLSHFKSEILLTRQLNIVEQMHKMLMNYFKIFESEKKLNEFIMLDFSFEMKRLENNNNFLQECLKIKNTIKY